MRRVRLAVVVAAVLLLAGCADAGDDTTVVADPTEAPTEEAADDATRRATDDGMDDSMGEADMDMSGAYGEPADASEAERTIPVEVDNELVFIPDEFEVAAGEVVTFQITNRGDVEHEFVLGDEEAQQQMSDEMAEGGDDHGASGEMSNAVSIHAGETADLTWRFPDEGTTVLIGCHVPGHYEAGMRGTVAVG